MNTKVHFSSKTDDWATPQALFDHLSALYGPFDIDVCASKENAKCRRFYSINDDGLSAEWYSYNKCWMNPPYGREIGKWVQKAYEESQKGCFVVALLPSRTDTRWFHDFIYNKSTVDITFLKGRLKFGGAKNSAPFPSMVVVFGGAK